MDDTNKTPSDVKLEPKVTLEQAMKVMGPKVESLMSEVLSGFELNAGDKKSKKRIFGALVTAAAKHMQEKENLSLGSLSRRASRAIGSLYPKYTPPSVVETDNDGDEGSGEYDEPSDD